MAAAAAGSEEARIIHALNVMCRMDPAKAADDAEKLAGLLGEDAGEEFTEKVDRPLVVATCPLTSRPYVQCDYNRDGDSFRSPWSNEYHPAVPLEDGEEPPFKPPARVRALEETANELLAVYASQYFGPGAVTSAYLWDQEAEGAVAGCFLVRSSKDGGKAVRGCAWNGIHVLEAAPVDGGEFLYRLTSTLVLELDVESEEAGTVTLSGSLSQKASQRARPPTVAATGPASAEPDHVGVWGPMVEAAERALRGTVESLYVNKSLTALSAARAAGAGPTQGAGFVASLNAAVLSHGAKRGGSD